MRRWKLVYNRWLNRTLTKLSTTRLIALAFAVIILTGTLLLMTPTVFLAVRRVFDFGDRSILWVQRLVRKMKEPD